MNDVVDLDADDGSALQRGQQHAAQGVAQRRTIATLQRLNDELRLTLRVVST